MTPHNLQKPKTTKNSLELRKFHHFTISQKCDLVKTLDFTRFFEHDFLKKADEIRLSNQRQF